MRSDKYVWQGRVDSTKKQRFHEIVQPVDLADAISFPSDKHTLAILGFCSDVGVKRNQGRLGAHEGPNAIRSMLANLPALLREDLFIVDAGNVSCDDDDLEASQKALGDAVATLLKHRATPLLLGGGHEIAWGHYQGIKTCISEQDIAIVNIDAHYDLRPLLKNGKGSSGTSFTQIAASRKSEGLPFHYYCFGIQKRGTTLSLSEAAEKLGTTTIYAEDFSKGQLVNKTVTEIIARHKLIYLTLCMDVFAQAFAPGVSAPQPLGLTPWQVIPLLQAFAGSKKVVGFDIAETCPAFDQDNQTARLAAYLLREWISFLKVSKNKSTTEFTEVTESN